MTNFKLTLLTSYVPNIVVSRDLVVTLIGSVWSFVPFSALPQQLVVKGYYDGIGDTAMMNDAVL